MRNISETPNKWVIVEMYNLESTHYKVFGSWTDDSWKLNSGIAKVEQDDDFYYFSGVSGSCYKCRKTSYGVASSYSESILDSFVSRLNGQIKVLTGQEDWSNIVEDNNPEKELN